MAEAFSLTLRGASGELTIEDPDLAEGLESIFLVQGVRGLDVVGPIPGATDVSAIELRGAPLETMGNAALEVWLSWEGVSSVKALLEEYARAHGIGIKAVEVPQTRSKLIAVAMGGGPVPDLVMVHSEGLAELVEARLLQPLDGLRSAPYHASGAAAFRLEHRLWALPFYTDVQLVFLNPLLVRRAPQPDWTLDELERSAEELRAAGCMPMAWNAYSAYWLAPFQMGFGKERLVEPDGTVLLDDEPTAQAITYLIELERRGLLTLLERDPMLGLFAAGKVGYVLSGSYSIAGLEQAGVPFEIAAFPRSRDGATPLSPLLDYKGFAVTRKSRSPLLARRLVQYLSRPDVQARFCTAQWKLPASEEAQAAVAGAWGARAPVLFDSLRSGTVAPPERSYAVYKDTMWRLLRLALTGEMSVDEVLELGQELVDRALEDSNTGGT